MRHPDVAIVKSAFTVYQAYGVYRFCDRFAIERSLVLLVNCYDAQLTTKPVAAEERSEAAAATTRGVQALEISHFVRRFAFIFVKHPRNSRSVLGRQRDL